MSLPDFGARVRAARAMRGLTQIELAEKLGISQVTLSGWEAKGSMRMTEMPRLAVALGVSVDFLCGRDECLGAIEPLVEKANRKRGKK